MSKAIHPIIELLCEDPRYPLEAYQFVRDGLSYAQEILGYGGKSTETEKEETIEERIVERHMTGQQLCEAIRRYAVDQYGFMAKVVLNNWGICETGDLGEIVYNLIRIGMMKKSDDDRREHFDGVFDFDEVFQQRFEITVPEGVRL